jgi:anti-sigma factor RsiW
MEINRNNYEACFLDYIEGRLSPDQEEVLRRFLKFNPDLSEELESFRALSVSPEKIEFPGKDQLKKKLPEKGDLFHPDQLELFCLAYLEGDLTEEQRLSFEEYLKEESEARTLLEKYKATILPKETILFPGKEKLKHKKSIVIDWRMLVPVAAAAAVFLLFIIGPREAKLPVEMASGIESEKKPENLKEEIKEKVNDPGSLPATLNVIRTKNIPVPVSNYKPKEIKDVQKAQETKEEKNNIQQRMAGTDLSPRMISEPDLSYDKIQLFAVAPPEVNNASLSLADLARYRFQKASEIVEDEDDILFSLASAGLKELSKVTGNEAKLLASRNDNGDISGIQFKSRFFNLTAPIPERDEE